MPFDGSSFGSTTPRPVQARSPWCGGLAAAFWSRLRGFYAPPAPPSIDAAVLRVLEEARGLIELRQDWTQRTLETVRGERCAVGAVRIAADFLDYRRPAGLALALLARVAASRGYSSIEAMNDHSRHQQVLSAFDEAIEVARFRSWAAEP
jgi:hypothetical protein